MSTVALLLASFTVLLLGSLVVLAAAGHRHRSGWLSVVFMGGAGLLLWTVALRTFLHGPDSEVTLLSVPGLGAGLTIMVDGLGALFLAIAATIGFLTALYAVRYLDRYPRDGVAKYYPVLLILFVGIAGVVSVADLLFFLVFWEIMTLTSYFLVVFEGENRASRKAGLKYFVMNQAATLGMLAAGLILWRESGSFHFEDLRMAFQTILADQPLVAHLTLLLLFLGFATKAGILPMGSWLPEAYPAAPTSATAAFAGAMSKLGVYGLVRFFLLLLPLSGIMETWGWIIAVAGTGSLFVGTLTALRQDDAKRLMSFHVVGQVGYMFLGVGVGLVLLPRSPLLGSLAIAAGLFHLVNNALYKSSLFLGAGAVHARTGTRSLGELGGLAPLMPWTAGAALAASLAIAGVPPLNGFASKWLLYGTGILGGQGHPALVVLILVAMFISLVTLASFLKYYGSSFLGSTREGGAPEGEVAFAMVLPQVVLVLGCLLFGLLPWIPLSVIQAGVAGAASHGMAEAVSAGVAEPWPGLLMGGLGGHPVLGFALGEPGWALWAPLPVTILLLVLAGGVYLGIQRAGGARTREVSVWVCGEEEEPGALRYSAGSFYLPFKHAFRGVYPSFRVRAPAFPAGLRRALDPDGWLYLPLARWVDRSARTVARTHVGVPQVYLLWIVLGAVVVVGVILLALG
jgi:hydrogenase-4 component B